NGCRVCKKITGRRGISAQAKDVQPKDAPAKGIQYIRRYHGYKKKPQSESEARKNMIAYLKNTKGFKMAFFKGKTYDQIRPIFQAKFDANMRFLLKSKEEMEKEEEEIIKSINETPAQKAAKRRRLQEVAAEVVPPTPTSPSPPSPVIPSSPPHQSPFPPQSQAAEGSSTLVQQIVKLKAKVKKLERLNKVKSSKLRRLKKFGTSQRIESSEDKENVFNQGRISVDIDEGIKLEMDQENDAKIEGRQADTQAEIYNIDLDHSSKVLSMQEDTEVQEAVKVVTTAKLITKVVTAVATQVAAASTPISAVKPKVLKFAAAAPAVSTRKRKGVEIRDPKEELHDDTPAETLSVKDKGKGILVKDPKPMKKKDQIEMDAEYAKKLQEEELEKRYYGFKKKPQSESKARKNMIAYLKNTEGFKMAYFKGKTYDQILPIFQARFDANMRFLFKIREEIEKEEEEIIKSINETPAQKAAKRRKKQSEKAQRQNDDVFVKAIPLAQKAPIVDYQVVVMDNKPKYKIIRADDTH
nr:hypothetical protein [Tanacetum cinerariifolium]